MIILLNINFAIVLSKTVGGVAVSRFQIVNAHIVRAERWLSRKGVCIAKDSERLRSVSANRAEPMAKGNRQFEPTTDWMSNLISD